MLRLIGGAAIAALLLTTPAQAAQETTAFTHGSLSSGLAVLKRTGARTYSFRACDLGLPDGRRVVAFASFNAGGSGALQNKVQDANGTRNGCGKRRRIRVSAANARKTIFVRACLRNGPRGQIHSCGATARLTPN